MWRCTCGSRRTAPAFTPAYNASKRTASPSPTSSASRTHRYSSTTTCPRSTEAAARLRRTRQPHPRRGAADHRVARRSPLPATQGAGGSDRSGRAASGARRCGPRRRVRPEHHRGPPDGPPARRDRRLRVRAQVRPGQTRQQTARGARPLARAYPLRVRDRRGTDPGTGGGDPADGRPVPGRRVDPLDHHLAEPIRHPAPARRVRSTTWLHTAATACCPPAPAHSAGAGRRRRCHSDEH